MNEQNEYVLVNGAPVPVSGPGIMGQLGDAGKQRASYRLTEKQRDFFMRQKQAMSNIEMGMRGALQMLVDEHALTGKVTLSDDCSELIAEAE